jgi:hypothetical protein
VDDIRIACTRAERRVAVIGCVVLALALAGFVWLVDLRAHGAACGRPRS